LIDLDNRYSTLAVLICLYELISTDDGILHLFFKVAFMIRVATFMPIFSLSNPTFLLHVPMFWEFVAVYWEKYCEDAN